MSEGGNKTFQRESEGEDLFFNDSVAGPDGSIYVPITGTPADAQIRETIQNNKNANIQVLDDGIALSNGLAFHRIILCFIIRILQKDVFTNMTSKPTEPAL